MPFVNVKMGERKMGHNILTKNQCALAVVVTLIASSGVFLTGARAIAAEAPKPAVQAAPRAARLVSKEAKEVEIISKELQGRVSARGPNGLALEFGRDVTKRSSQEIWFPYVTDIKLQGYKSLQEIEEGDTILAVYEEAEDMSKRTLTGIRLIQKKPPEEEETSEEEEDGAETGKTGESGDR